MDEARSAAGERPLIADWRDAEELSAQWIQRLGFPDARATPASPDGGLDVVAAGAVGQSKAWTGKRVGIKDVQRLRGAALLGQACFFFFSTSGYTKSAICAAEASRGALFRLRRDGWVQPVNFMAYRAMWQAPLRLGSPASKPLRPIWFLLLGVIPVACLLLWTPVLPMAVANGHGSVAAVSMWTVLEGMHLALLLRTVHGIRSALRWRGKGSSEVEQAADATPGQVLPPEQWRGLVLRFPHRLVGWLDDVAYRSGAARAWFVSRRLRHRSRSGNS